MLDLDKTNFEDEVLKAEGYVFVDFYGDGCVPCQALMPKVHAFADTYGDKLKFISEYNKSTPSCNQRESSWTSSNGYLQRWSKSRRACKRRLHRRGN